MSAHTKGPWTVEYGESLAIRSADDSRLATMNWLRGRHGLAGRLSDEEVAANALVFAAAPDLLSIAKRWVALDAGGWHPDRCAADKAQLIVDTLAAIAKSEGK